MLRRTSFSGNFDNFGATFFVCQEGCRKMFRLAHPQVHISVIASQKALVLPYLSPQELG